MSETRKRAAPARPAAPPPPKTPRTRPKASGAGAPAAASGLPGGLTHFDGTGQAHMVDVGDKAPSRRVAVAAGSIRMLPATLALVVEGRAGKGDVLGVARIAAIQAAKRTSDLIPLCHPIPLTRVAAEFAVDTAGSCVTCTVTVRCEGRTGVEMEALTAASVGLLTIYDMCKAVDRGMTIESVRLLEKHGGKSGSFVADGARPDN